MKIIAYKRPEDGGVSIIIPAPDCGLTLDQIARKDVPSGIDYSIIDDADLPQDRSDRDAWVMVESGSGKSRRSVVKVDQKRKKIVDEAKKKHELERLDNAGASMLDLMEKKGLLTTDDMTEYQKGLVRRRREISGNG